MLEQEKSGGASGSVNRWLRPDSVRHMSATTAMQGLTAAHHDTQRDNKESAREPGYAQATGHFRWWWQVLGSKQRRLSRRFYRPPIPTHRNSHWPAVPYFPRREYRVLSVWRPWSRSVPGQRDAGLGSCPIKSS